MGRPAPDASPGTPARTPAEPSTFPRVGKTEGTDPIARPPSGQWAFRSIPDVRAGPSDSHRRTRCVSLRASGGVPSALAARLDPAVPSSVHAPSPHQTSGPRFSGRRDSPLLTGHKGKSTAACDGTARRRPHRSAAPDAARGRLDHGSLRSCRGPGSMANVLAVRSMRLSGDPPIGRAGEVRQRRACLSAEVSPPAEN